MFFNYASAQHSTTAQYEFPATVYGITALQHITTQLLYVAPASELRSAKSAAEACPPPHCLNLPVGNYLLLPVPVILFLPVNPIPREIYR